MKKSLVGAGGLITGLLIIITSNLMAMPISINYQGRLREYNQPVSGTRTMNFKIYSSSSSAIPVWASGDVQITVTSGTFSYQLNPTGVDWRSDELWLETTVSGKILSPREKLLAVPYARHSFESENLNATGLMVNANMNRIVNVSTPTAFDDCATKGYVESWLPVGTILMWGGSQSSIPTGWLLCDGSAISRTTYSRLFAAIGTTHGAGDGSTTFNLPNLRDRFIVGAGNSYVVAATGGEATHTLTVSEIPSHSHTASCSTNGAHTHIYSKGQFVNNGQGGSGYGVWAATPYVDTATSSSGDHNHTITIGSTGGNAAHENRPPYYALCYIIKY